MVLAELVRYISEQLFMEYGIEVVSELFQKESTDIHIRVFEKQSDLLIGFNICLSWRKIRLSFSPRYVITNSHVYHQWALNAKDNWGAFELFTKNLKKLGIHLRYQVNQDFFDEYPLIDDYAFFSIDAASDFLEVRDNLEFYQDNIMPILKNFWGLILSFTGIFELEDLPEEGTMRVVQITKYERNPVYRKLCLDHFGSFCQICGEDLEKKYGSIASGLIEVHHIEPVSEYTNPKVINPISDLVPVCPNCHAILHRRKPAYTPEEIKEMINRRGN